MNSTNPEIENIKLKKEIESLKSAVNWYKRTYEERSLPAIVYDRLFGKRTKLTSTPKVKISNTHTPFSNSILCTIVNHNYGKNASILQEQFLNYFDTIIIDSGSESPPKNSLKLENIFYTGLLNTAYAIAKRKKYKFLLFICSDVIIKPEQTTKIFDRLSTIDLAKMGLYSPSSIGFSHQFCKKQPGGKLREVPFVEGFMFLCDMNILDSICPINTQINLYGWGLDIASSFFAKLKNKLIVIDDNVEVEHLSGTGYPREIAETEMLTWIKSLNNETLLEFFNHSIDTIKQGDTQ